MLKTKASESGVIDCINVMADSNFSPGLDVVFVFKGLDGTVNEIGVSVRVCKQPHLPGSTSRVELFLGGYHNAGLRLKNKPIDGILLKISRPAALAVCLTDVAGYLSAIASATAAATTSHGLLNLPEMAVPRVGHRTGTITDNSSKKRLR